MKKFSLSLLFICLASTSSFASLNSEVNTWFSNQDYANVTPAGSYETQAGRMYTGGGISTRSQVSPVFELVNIQSPKISAGCGGIDIFTGGFSHINADQFVESLRAIGQNAKSLAMMMAIKIVTPQLEDLMNKVKGFADRFNQFQTDSCQAASALLETGTRALGWTESCVTLRMERLGETRAVAENSCTTGGKGLPQLSNDETMNRKAFVEGNLVWNVLMQDSYFRNDLDLAELLMNITGTVILDKGSGSDPEPKVKAKVTSIIGNDYTSEQFKNIFNALYLGNKSSERLVMYKCSAGDRSANIKSCTSLTQPQNVTVSWEGMKTKVDNILASITNKIVTGQGRFTATEIGLIESTNLPIYRFISAATASDMFAYSTNDNPAEQFGNLIAQDIVLKNLQNLVEKVQFRVENDTNNLSDDKTFKEFAAQLKDVRIGLSQQQYKVEREAELIAKMQNDIIQYEKRILTKVQARYVDAAKFGK
ncbi:conjugal transfer protein TraH [Acinetobacter baumannii]|uniref:conjugal transfer protein TraH n=2 Tax=Acinetobacter baumannii TaxID=470 RepID=UPI0003480E1E|nr:conjugal transfer protein TraH [Acinetobacter baumannii]EKV6896148.1 conjugal transfer protein TraH [Acinetobacter baumannii]MBD0230624.1 conjugal transfer protein TraH [Acinetobacter baumannii]MBD0502951.1 conjugal transfer protein TraH [Acinetobacter baumannii]MBZ0351858.1 conjugal transfer protein TraH [Acinetobacter baumannii]MCW8631763.1 conjugal transfer protein TraH [Acinetobacter baumannii]